MCHAQTFVVHTSGCDVAHLGPQKIGGMQHVYRFSCQWCALIFELCVCLTPFHFVLYTIKYLTITGIDILA